LTSLLSGQAVLHYRIIDQVGQGGMGEVYKAEDLKLGRHVAIKVLPPRVIRDRTARQRLLREARSASALNHPNIVTVHSIDEAGGLDFIVMEYVEGRSLRATLDRGPVEWPRLVEWGAQVADALAAAHARGLVHRDVKPANILITPRDQVKLLDFGLATMVRALPTEMAGEAETLGGALTGTGEIVGTVAYMSPEQTRGESLDAGSDVFSLGVTLYEAATGTLPFAGPTLLARMHEIRATDPPRPSSIKQDLPRELDRIIERALRKERERRCSASELAEALRGLKESAREGASAATAADAERVDGQPEVFVGREPELKTLEGFLRKAAEGAGRVVFVTGEPGIGKTALADEFLRRAGRKHAILCRGHCSEQYGTGEAYLPFLDAFGALLTGRDGARIAKVLRAHAPTWCLQFQSLAAGGSLEQLQRETIGATKERMLREMGDGLGALATERPVVLLLEDLHWSDPSSVDLLRYLSHRIREQHLLVVGTFRPGDVELSKHPLKNCKREMQAHQRCEELALGPLEQEHIARYLDARFAPNSFSAELAALIERKTEGHPLFATSLVQFLAERGGITRAEERWTLRQDLSEIDLEVPESVRGMIRRKVEVLEEEDRRTLQYASIEGEEFTSTVLAALLGIDDLALEERLDRLARVHGLVEARGEEEWPDGTLTTRYRFAHALYQNLLYGDLVSKRRMLLHRQAGEQLLQHHGEQAPHIATQLAIHFEHGRDFSRAIEYLIVAGDNATKVYANDEAERHYSHALALVEKLRIDEQTDYYVSLYRKRGAANHVLSRFDQALDDFARMLHWARAAGSAPLEHAALNALTTSLFFSHRTGEMSAPAAEALRLAESSGDEALRLETMTLIAAKHQCYGEPEGKPILDEVIRVARALGLKSTLLSGLAHRGFWHFLESEYAIAEERINEAVALASELREGFWLLHAHFGLGLVLGNLGRMSEALRILNAAIEMARKNGDHFFKPRLPNCIGWIHRELQDFDHAKGHDESGVEIARQEHVLEAEANSLINLASDYTFEGAGEKPVAAFREAEAIFLRDDWYRWRYNIRLQAGQAEYWLAQGNPERGEEYARRLLETSTRYAARKYIVVAHRLLAEVAIARGDWPLADTELSAALDVLVRYPAPLAAWRIHAVLARLRLQLGESQAARDAFAEAAGIVGQIAANVDDERLRATFLASAAVRQVVEGAGGALT
jgi:tRNA A-37 threonylcarbamoyl transferase component Bud32/tetratricopeptide (TPR) repeat protein